MKEEGWRKNGHGKELRDRKREGGLSFPTEGTCEKKTRLWHGEGKNPKKK